MSNHPSEKTFEELQFFSGQSYANGIDWYMDFFPPADGKKNGTLYFEKSATYFDNVRVFIILLWIFLNDNILLFC